MGTCDKCGGSGRVVRQVDGDEFVEPCPACAEQVIAPGPEVYGAPMALWPGKDPRHVRITSYVKQMPGVVKDGVGLFVTGGPNSGKTSTLLWIMSRIEMEAGWPEAHMRYLRMRELLSKLAEDWRGIQKEIDAARELDLLAVDDAFDAKRGWMENDARKTALDEFLRAYVEDGGALLMASVLDMDEVANVWGRDRAGLLDKRLAEIKLTKDFSAAAQREVGRRLKK